MKPHHLLSSLCALFAVVAQLKANCAGGVRFSIEFFGSTVPHAFRNITLEHPHIAYKQQRQQTSRALWVVEVLLVFCCIELKAKCVFVYHFEGSKHPEPSTTNRTPINNRREDETRERERERERGRDALLEMKYEC